MGRKNRNASKPIRTQSSYDQFDDEPFFKGSKSVRLFNKLEYRNDAQRKAHDEIRDYELTFLGGPAGTAKTFLPCAEAVRLLQAKKIDKIVISRPMVDAARPMGHLPGGIKDKCDPYLVPIYDNLEYFLGKDQLKAYLEEGVIDIVPIQFMRGRTINRAFIILDEMQNATKTQLRMALTRIGEDSTCVVTYDEDQIDLDSRRGDITCVDDIYRFYNKKGIGFYRFGNEDIVRSAIVKRVLEIYAEEEFDVEGI